MFPNRHNIEKATVIAAALLLALLVLVPPWKMIPQVGSRYPIMHERLWHAPLWNAPISSYLLVRTVIDTERLLLEGTAIVLIAAVMIYAVRR